MASVSDRARPFMAARPELVIASAAKQSVLRAGWRNRSRLFHQPAFLDEGGPARQLAAEERVETRGVGRRRLEADLLQPFARLGLVQNLPHGAAPQGGARIAHAGG